jgi:hypothetical protein
MNKNSYDINNNNNYYIKIIKNQKLSNSSCDINSKNSNYNAQETYINDKPPTTQTTATQTTTSSANKKQQQQHQQEQ